MGRQVILVFIHLLQSIYGSLTHRAKGAVIAAPSPDALSTKRMFALDNQLLLWYSQAYRALGIHVWN
jgi:hypothetical protein